MTVGHTVLQEGRPCVEEEQVIVYREPAPRPEAATARRQPARQKAVAPGQGGETADAAGADHLARAGDVSSGIGGRAGLTLEWTETFLPTTVTLFQFSALTYNGHRVHYDHPYVTEQEGYPGLLVHGPLTALLLLDAARRHSPRPVTQFRYRALAPLFVDQPITLAGQTASAGAEASDPLEERIVEALAPSGAVAMRGWVT